jgi:RNA recognition motif-containing protein
LATSVGSERGERKRRAEHLCLQVDYASTPEEIQAHFASCGTINRVTILFDKFTGPKGLVARSLASLFARFTHLSSSSYAYVEFADPSLVANAVLLNESMFRGRLLKVRFLHLARAAQESESSPSTLSTRSPQNVPTSLE